MKKKFKPQGVIRFNNFIALVILFIFCNIFFGSIFYGGILLLCSLFFGTIDALFWIIAARIALPLIFVGNVIFIINWLKKQHRENYLSAISYAYCWSIREALKTQYPEGVVYILENTLKELAKFGLANEQPSKRYDSNSNNTFGFPNQTNLREAISMADHLSLEWNHLENLERARAMTEIREKIKQEEFFLYHFTNTISGKEIYWFSYTEDEHQNMLDFHTPSSPKPRQKSKSKPSQTRKPQPKVSKNSQTLSFDDWIEENSVLKFVSSEEQIKAYNKYLDSLEVLSFEEWLSQNPGSEMLPLKQQKQAYQKYLSSHQ